eukprot:scaffold7611_cov183-Amphora_coffeaeformis.AAC.1
MEEEIENQYEDDDDESMNASSEYLSTSADAAAFYGYEDRVSTSEIMDNFPEGPGSPLPADRLARKQRHFGRRGGHCHSSLLHSAVMACMSSPKDDEGKPSLDSSSLMLTSSSETSSPRKRLRRTDRRKPQVDEQVIAGASVMLANLTMSPLDSTGHSAHNNQHDRMSGDFNRAPPVRRVSRRKSYTSVASGASDYDDEEFFNLDD